MAQTSKSYEVKFIGNTTALTKSFQNVSRSANALGRDVSRSSNFMRNAIAGVSVAGLVAGLRSATKAAGEDQKAQLKLAQTLRNVTGATDEAIAATEQFITEQQFATGVSDSQLRPALENLTRATGDVTKAQELLKLGLDVSAGSGRDLESISLALARAQGGQFTGLQRLGIIIPENIKKSKDFGKVQEYLNGLFGGQAAVAANTYEGKLAILRERLGEVQESIGGALIPVLTGLADKVLKDIMPSLEVFVNALTGNSSISSSLSESQQTALNWGNTIRAVFQTVINYRGEIMAFGAVIVGVFAVAKIAAAGSAIVKIIGGIVKTYQTLQTAAVLAATAMAFGSGGLSVAAGVAGAAVAAGAMAAAFIGVNKVLGTYQKNVDSLPKIEIAPDGVLKDAKVYKDVVLPTVDGVGKTSKKTGKEVKGLSKDVKGLSDEGKAAKNIMAKLADTLADNQQKLSKLKDQLEIAKETLSSARESFNDYKTSVRDAITGILDFGSAQEQSTNSLNSAKDAQLALVEAQAEYSKSLTTKDVEAQQNALEKLQAAQTAATNSVTNKKSFIQVLQDQAALASTFANKVQTLISMGLSETAIGQVLSAGADAGTKIADEIIAGGSTVVDQVNTLVTATASVATQVGQMAATEFYSAGVTAGKALVDGIKSAITDNKELFNSFKDAAAAAGFKISADGTIVNKGAIDQVNAAIAQAKSGKGKKSKITKKERQSIMDLAASLGVEVPAFAKGGIVTGPTLALIGEAGPEAVVPLSGRNAGMGNTINLTVNAGMGADGNQIGRDIVDAIKRYERTSGPVFASA